MEETGQSRNLLALNHAFDLSNSGNVTTGASSFGFSPLEPFLPFASTQPATSSPTSGIYGETSLPYPMAVPSPRRSKRIKERGAHVVDPSAESALPQDTRKRSAEAVHGRRGKRARRECKKPPPKAKDDKGEGEGAVKSETHEEVVSCCICMSEPSLKNISTINGCKHHFCFDCISKWADRENTCPLCKSRFSRIHRIHKSKKRKGEKTPPNTKTVRSRDQRSDYTSSGATLDSMLNNIRNGPRLSRLIGAIHGRMSIRSQTSMPLLFDDHILESDEDSFEGGAENFNELIRAHVQVARGPFAALVGRPTVPPGFSFPMAGATYPPPHAVAPSIFGMLSSQPTVIPSVTLPQRSYAVNMNDSTAGRAAENPIEIDDSSDDEIEVLGSNHL